MKTVFADENDYDDENTIKEVYPWAAEIIEVDGGWMAFESAADAEVWKCIASDALYATIAARAYRRI